MPPKTDDERNEEMVAATLAVALVQCEATRTFRDASAIVSLHRQILLEMRKPATPC